LLKKKESLKEMRRVVLKVGSHVLTENSRIAIGRLANLVELIANLHREGKDIIVVSSGAIASGYTQLQLDKSKIANKQALAAIGQPYLLKIYQTHFAHYGVLSAQILLSADDFDSRRRTQYAKDAVEVMLKSRVVPIVNENDVVATEELVFGDNDRLSAHVAYYFDADILIILSDIKGYYDKDPNSHKDAKLRKVVNSISKDELNRAFNPNGAFATGGIVTKLQSAEFLMQRDIAMFLGSGFDLSDAKSFLIEKVHRGGTLFLPYNREREEFYREEGVEYVD
jgi:glutamate 5-kinase